MDRRVEAGRRSLQGLERHRAGDVRGTRKTCRPHEQERCHRAHELRAVDERETLLRLEHHGLETGGAQRLRARQHPTADGRLAFPDERQRKVRQRREVSARTDRASCRHVGDDIRPEHRDEQLDRLDAGAGVSLRESVRPQEHRGAHDLVGVRLADPAGVTPKEPELQLGRLLRRDRLRDEATEARVDAVRVVTDLRLEERTRGGRALASLCPQRDGPVLDRDVPDVADGEVVPGELDRRRHGRESSPARVDPFAEERAHAGEPLVRHPPWEERRPLESR